MSCIRASSALSPRAASLLLVTAVASWACKTESPADGKSASEAGKAKSQPISAVCKEQPEIDPEAQAKLEAAAREVHGALATGDVAAVEKSLHPQAHTDDKTIPTVAEALQGMSERLQEVDASRAALDRMVLVDVAGGVSDLARTICPGNDKQDRVTMLLNAGDEDVALVTLTSPGKPLSLTTTVVLRQHGERWATVAVHVGPHAYRGKGAKELEAAGAAAVRAGKTLPAFVLFALARTLAERGTAVSTHTQERVDEKLEQLQEQPDFGKELGVWELQGQSFEIQGVTLASTRSDVSPVVHYVSPGGLVREHLEREADVLIAELRKRYPELQEYFDAVVFEAKMDAPPSDRASKTYEAYRIVRFLDPERQP